MRGQRRSIRVCAVAALAALTVPGALAPSAGASAGPSAAVSTVAAVTPPPAPSFTKVSAGLRHSCGLSPAGQVSCWGTNVSGILGNPSVTAAWYPIPVAVAGTPLEGVTVTDVESGVWDTCAITVAGALACWGQDNLGQLGDGGSTTATVPVAVAVAGTPLEGAVVTQVSMSTTFACARTQAGVVSCWGSGEDGRLGRGSTAISRTPTALVTAGTPLAGKTFTSVSTGSDHACAVTTDGLLSCWGDNTWGQLGNGTKVGSTLPELVTTAGTPLAGKAITKVAAGTMHTCALASDGSVACWGLSGELGAGNTGDALVPVAVTTAGSALEGKVVTDIQASYIHTCATTSQARLACWGSNSSGQLGIAASRSDIPVEVATGGTVLASKPIADVALGQYHSCATTTAGIAACWGGNDYGQLGRNNTTESSVPTSPRMGTAGPATAVHATLVDGEVHLSWTAPTSTGGSPVTGYQVLPLGGGIWPGAVRVFASTATAQVITGLPIGVAYSFRVAATNLYGTSGYSPQSETVTVPPPRSAAAPFADWGAFVDRQYVDVIGRAPTASERGAATSALSAGSKTSYGLVDELRRSGENATNVDPAARLYRAFLGRAPDPSGLRYWIKRRRTGTWTLTRMADYFAGSSEFKRRYGSLTNQQFVILIYTDVLGRDADATGVDYWTHKLDTKQRSRGGVMASFSESSEYKTKQAENTDAAVAHVLLLGRMASPEETSSWVTREKSGTATHAVLLAEILNSAGYAAHVAA